MVKKVSFPILMVLITFASIVALLHGFEFFFNPYRGMPQNGWIGNELYTWGHLVKK